MVFSWLLPLCMLRKNSGRWREGCKSHLMTAAQPAVTHVQISSLQKRLKQFSAKNRHKKYSVMQSSFLCIFYEDTKVNKWSLFYYLSRYNWFFNLFIFWWMRSFLVEEKLPQINLNLLLIIRQITKLICFTSPFFSYFS